MRILLQRDENMFVIAEKAGVYYTFNKEEATDFSNKTVEDFTELKMNIEKKEGYELEPVYK